MIRDEAVKVDASDSPNDLDLPRNALDAVLMKVDRRGGVMQDRVRNRSNTEMLGMN